MYTVRVFITYLYSKVENIKDIENIKTSITGQIDWFIGYRKQNGTLKHCERENYSNDRCIKPKKLLILHAPVTAKRAIGLVENVNLKSHLFIFFIYSI